MASGRKPAGKRRAGAGAQREEKLALDRRARIVSLIRVLPAGTVSSYGAIARAAGWPGAARQVVRILRQVPGLPWQRVVGSGGAIKLPGENGAEQRFRLRMEGVSFRGARVDMKKHEFKFARGTGRQGKSRS
jgi:methylated-DNA-protein-cysteine methyltransferase related protein